MMNNFYKILYFNYTLLILITNINAVQLSNNRKSTPGTRAALLGGAYCALSDDAAGSYYNPAGVVFSKDNGISLSTTAVANNSITIKNAINEHNFVEKSTLLYPAFIGALTKVSSNLTAGYSLFTLDFNNIYQHDVFSDLSDKEGEVQSYARSHQEVSNYIYTGGSIAYKFNKNYSIGLSQFYYQRTSKASTHQAVQTLGNRSLRIIDENYETNNTGLSSILGIMYRSELLSLGLSLQIRTSLKNKTIRQVDAFLKSPNSENVELQRASQTYHGFDELNPDIVRAGFALWPKGFITISSDIIYYSKADSTHIENKDLYSAIDYSVGMEVDFSLISLKAGIFSNNSQYKKPENGSKNSPLYLNYSGKSFGVGWKIKSFTGQIGYSEQNGTGSAQIISDSTDIQDVESTSKTYLIGGQVPLI